MEDNYYDILISKKDLSLDEVYEYILHPECGGINLFVGTVRNFNKGKRITKLEFESYEPMALKIFKEIANECREKFDVKKISIRHRVGVVPIKGIAVIIGVSTKHRKNAFLATEYAIDQLKERVPIWKKEFLEDGSYWVNARP